METIKAPESIGSVMEDLGYRKNIIQSQDYFQAQKKLEDVLKKFRNSSKRPSVKIRLRTDKNIYRYRADIAYELIKNHKADLVEIIE